MAGELSSCPVFSHMAAPAARAISSTAKAAIQRVVLDRCLGRFAVEWRYSSPAPVCWTSKSVILVPVIVLRMSRVGPLYRVIEEACAPPFGGLCRRRHPFRRRFVRCRMRSPQTRLSRVRTRRRSSFRSPCFWLTGRRPTGPFQWPSTPAAADQLASELIQTDSAGLPPAQPGARRPRPDRRRHTPGAPLSIRNRP